MSTLNPPKTISKRHELREDRVITFYARAWEFFDKNKTIVYGVIAAIAVVIAGMIGYSYMQGQSDIKAQKILGGIISVYEQGDYRAALDGTETNAGLLAIIKDHGGTSAGNLAQFYAADAYFRLGEYDQALEHFKAFDKGDNLIGASAYAGEAAIYEVKGEYKKAGDLYTEAAFVFESNVTSPRYLISAGRAYEGAEAYADAKKAYQSVKDKFSESSQASGMDFYLARVEAKMK